MRFKPFNKWLVMKTIAEDEKVGLLYIPGSIANQYKRATVVAVPEVKDVQLPSVGDVVFYDTVGEVRIGRGKDETILVSYLNVLGSVLPDEVI